MKKKFSWLVVFLSVLLTQLAFAAEDEPPQQVAQRSSVYRCTEPDGRHTYTDSPCPGEGQRIKGYDPDPSQLSECQGLQEEMDMRIKMQSMKSVSPTPPAYMAWLQQKLDACKRRQRGGVDETGDNGAPEKDGASRKRFPTGAIPSHLDNSHLRKNPPRLPASGSTKDGRDRDKADNPPPTSYDLRDKNWLPPVRNQNPFGTCWAHTAQGAAESNAISQGFDNTIIQRYT